MLVQKSNNTNAPIVIVTLGVFTILTLFLIVIDFVPEPVSKLEPTTSIVATASAESITPVADSVQTATSEDMSVVETPVRIVIDAIGVDTTIVNPASTDIDVLDRALLSGAVRYPGSGLLQENANMLLFGHSSYLPVVRNKAFQAFNAVEDLSEGSEITIYSETRVYTYGVSRVYLSRAEEALVQFTASSPMLTLATCNTFGAEEDRWVVEAFLVSSRTL